MRTLQLLEDASVCQQADALRDPVIKSSDQLRAVPLQDCPLLEPCNAGTLLGPNLRNCIPRMAQDVARYVRRGHSTVEAEMRDFRNAPVFSKLGFIDPYDDPDPDKTITDRDEICRRVAEWAYALLGEQPLATDFTGRIDLSRIHCVRHDAYDEGCSDCRMARLVALDQTEVVWPSGIPKRVPRDDCRCPIMRVGDFCPVHGG